MASRQQACDRNVFPFSLVNQENEEPSPQETFFVPWFVSNGQREYSKNEIPSLHSTTANQPSFLMPRKGQCENKDADRQFQKRTYMLMCIGVLALASIGAIVLAFFAPLQYAHAAESLQSQSALGTPSQCSQEHTVLAGETLSSIASQHNMSWTTLATLNRLANPNQLQAGQTLCILPAIATNSGSLTLSSAYTSSSSVATGQSNLFQYPQCTWWANERYYQIHHVYVPWTTNADAWEWPTRAAEFGWHVSSTPTVGAIIAVQGNHQGTLSLGHVGVVEKILPNGHVMTSNMNWGADPTSVTTVEFYPSSKVSFISR